MRFWAFTTSLDRAQIGSYAANVRTTAAELRQRIEAGTRLIVDALRAAAAEVSDGGEVGEATAVLQAAFLRRNSIDAAVTGAVGALDRAVSRVPDQRLTAGLCCATWLAQQCRLSPGQVHATPRPPAPLPAGHPPGLRAGGDLLPARLGGGPLRGDGGARRRGPL